MKKVLTIIIFMFSINSFSQEIIERNWILKVNTTQLIDIFSFPTVQLSAERKLNPYLSVNAEFGYQLYQLYDYKTEKDTISLEPKGLKANLELRFYIYKFFQKRKISESNELFCGLQLFYRHNQKSWEVEYRRIDNENIYYDDSFGVKKTVVGINLNFGVQISISKKIILEPYFLIGYMKKKIENLGLKYNEVKHIADRNDGIPLFVGLDIENKNGYGNINFGFGLRLGYKF